MGVNAEKAELVTKKVMQLAVMEAHDIPSKQTLKLAMDYYCHFAARQGWCKQSHKGIYLR